MTLKLSYNDADYCSDCGCEPCIGSGCPGRQGYARRYWIAGLAVAGILVMSSCSAQLGDRGGKEGSPVDKVSDVDYVEVYRNADNTPNVAKICVAGAGFASTMGGLRGEGAAVSPSLVRMTEWDAFCATKKRAA